MKQFTEIVKKMDEDKKDIVILPTGFKNVDDHLDGGFLLKEFVVLGGGTGRGKSMFAGTMFYNVASKGYKSAYFSLEISNEMIVSRIIGAKSNISPIKVMIKMLNDRDTEQKELAQDKISVFEDFMFFYDDLYELDKICKEITEHNYDFVVIDFIQNIMTKEPDEYRRLSMVALVLQKLAKDTNTCILGLSQLSNQITKDKRDDVVEYKGSGSIGTVCDLGFFIKQSGMDGYMTLQLRKNRRGISGADFSFNLELPGGQITSSII